MCRFLHLFDSRTGLALDGFHINLVETLHKQVAVFRIDNGLHGRAEHFDAVLC